MSGKNKSSNTNTIIGTIIILLLLLLIIIALIILLKGGNSGPEQQEETPVVTEIPSEEPPKLSATPQPSTPTPTPAPTPTPSEEPTPSPSATPKATATPALSPRPSATPRPSPSFVPPPSVAPNTDASSSGSFNSDSGTSLNTVVSWNAKKTSDGNVELEVKLLLSSGRLNMTPKNSGAVLTIGSESYTLYTPEINKEDNEYGLSWLCTKKVTLPYTEGMSVPVDAVFNYGGTYSGVEIGKITAQGTAVIS